MKNNRPLFVRISTAMCLFFFAVFVVLPLWSIFSLLSETDAASIFASTSFKRALQTSVVSASLVSVFTVAVSFCAAWILRRVDVPLGRLWRVMLILPMLVPSVSLGNGLVTLFGTNGYLVNLFRLPITIYGLHGVVLGQVIYCIPPIFLLIDNMLRYEDYTPHEAAIVLGIPAGKRLWGLTVPYIRPTLISALLLSFTMSATDYGIPFAVGGKLKTLASVMYSEVAGQLKFGKGSVIGLCLLVPATLAFLADTLIKSRAPRTVVNPFPLKAAARSRAWGSLFCLLTALLTFLPIFSFLVMMLVDDYPLRMVFTLEHLLFVFRGSGAKGLLNSLLISAGAALTGTVLSAFAAYSTSRHRASWAGRILHLLAAILQAIPGLVLGLAFILAFKKSVLYGTFGILILVNTVHFFTIPYMMLYQRFGEMNENLEPISSVLGIRPFRLFLDVFLPQCRATLFEMYSYFFVNSMVTISAVSFLATASTRPLSMLIMQYSDQMNPETAAAFSFVILVINLAMQIFAGRQKTI